MSASQLLRDQLRQAHEFLEGAVADVNGDQIHWHPAGQANPLGATYAHILFGEDAFVAGLRGRTPLFADSWNGRTGVSEFPPLAEPGTVPPLNSDWHDWARRVQIDLPALRHYGQAVAGEADGYLASLRDDDLHQTVDLSEAGFGTRPMAWILSNGLVGHVLAHWGEIVCLKGLQGGRGFPV